GRVPRAPRRVPGAGRPRAVAAGGAVALPRPLGSPGWGRRALRRLATLADHPLLDRLLTGRAWIGLIAFALIGIVFMQVSLLKLNAGIGRSVERASILDRYNAELRARSERDGHPERRARSGHAGRRHRSDRDRTARSDPHGAHRGRDRGTGGHHAAAVSRRAPDAISATAGTPRRERRRERRTPDPTAAPANMRDVRSRPAPPCP